MKKIRRQDTKQNPTGENKKYIPKEQSKCHNKQTPERSCIISILFLSSKELQFIVACPRTTYILAVFRQHGRIDSQSQEEARDDTKSSLQGARPRIQRYLNGNARQLARPHPLASVHAQLPPTSAFTLSSSLFLVVVVVHHHYPPRLSRNTIL